MALRIRWGAQDLWQREATKTRLRISDFGAELKKDGQVNGRWQLDKAGELDVEAWLQWSRDRGQTWHALTTGLRGDRASLDTAGIPSGQVELRLLVSDGFHTAVSRKAAIRLLKRAPDVSILSPRDGQTLVTGQTMRLWGAATRDAEPVPGRFARWQLDGKTVARGLDSAIPAPPAGEHSLTLVVSAYSKRVEVSVKFTTVNIPGEEELEQSKLG